jgi:hypothetical protein
MSRLLAVSLTLAFVPLALADLGPRPKLPVQPTKAIPVNNVLKYANEFPNHTFWAITDGPNGFAVVPMKAEKSKPHPLNLKGVKSAVIYAIPNEVAKQIDTPREFIQLAAANKLPDSVVASPLLLREESVFNTDRRTSIDRVIVVSGGLKNGIAFTEEDPLPAKKESPQPRKNDPEPEMPTVEERPAPQLMLAGLAAAGAAMFGGLWLVRRR